MEGKAFVVTHDNIELPKETFIVSHTVINQDILHALFYGAQPVQFTSNIRVKDNCVYARMNNSKTPEGQKTMYRRVEIITSNK